MAIKTLEEQLESVQAATAAIEGGTQSARYEGVQTTHADLQTLYRREADLLQRLGRQQRGGIDVRYGTPR